MADTKQALTLRQKIGIKLIMLLLTIVNPTGYTHELSKPFEEIDKLIKLDD